MKQINLTIKIPALPVTIGLVAILALTLLTNVLTSSAETLNRPSDSNPSGNGTITGCVGSSTPTGQSLFMAGRVITPSNLVSLNPSGTCGANETAVSWNVQGPKGDKGDKGDPTYARTVVVSPVGTFTQNGTALLAAMAQIAAANPTSSTPYLLKVEPGGYDLGNNSLTLVPNVDLEGSGVGITSIISTVGSGGSLTNATVILAGNNGIGGLSNSIRNISIFNNGSADYNACILIKSGNYYNASISDVVLLGVGTGNGQTSGEFYGISNSGLYFTINNAFIGVEYNTNFAQADTRKNIGIDNHVPLTIQNSTIITEYNGTNIAVRSDNADLTILNSTLTANRGAYTNRAVSITNSPSNSVQATIQNSNLSATSVKPAQNAALYNDNGSGGKNTIVQNSTLRATGDTTLGGTLDAIYNPGKLLVGASEISGNVNNTGTLACAASYNGSFVEVGSLCV